MPDSLALDAPAPAERVPLPRAPRWRPTPAVGLLLLGLLLVLVCAASLAWGARDIPLSVVLDAIFGRTSGDTDHSVVLDQRLPRTVVGLLGGAALAVAGALMQGTTRNPIADPGLLGVNAGSALAVVSAILLFGITDPAGFVWFAFFGAAVSCVVVYGVASLGWGGVTPVKLALVGAAFAAVATSMVTLVLLTDVQVLEQYRFWSVGSLANRPWNTILVIAPFVLVGLAAQRADRPLPQRHGARRRPGPRPGSERRHSARLVSVVAVILLCGGAVSLVGPDRVRRPDGAAHRAAHRRPRLPVGAALLGGPRTDRAADRRHHRPRDRAPLGDRGRARRCVGRGARADRSGTPVEGGVDVSQLLVREEEIIAGDSLAEVSARRRYRSGSSAPA